MKQLAVEWLAEQINGLDTAVSLNYFKQKVEQAKEMEEKQLKEMYLKGIENYDPTFKQQEQ
jgi:hypothetical protein